jgi:carboxyl-terminal processing protease
MSKFWTVYEIIKDNYFDWNKIEDKDLLEGAIYWLVGSLKDNNSSYFNMKENKDFTQSLNGNFEGIWAVVATHPQWVVVDSIIKYSPAQDADIKIWDIIIKASNESLEWFTVSEAVDRIKWPAWTTVNLEIIRGNTLISKEVVRRKIKIPSVEFEKLEGNIWYISINMFWDETSREFENSVYELRNTDGIVIDLRKIVDLIKKVL